MTGDRAKAAGYRLLLAREIAVQAAYCTQDDSVRLMHWGGRTPTCYDDAQLAGLMACLRAHSRLRTDADISIEVGPHGLDAARIEAQVALGFNRLSLGVQDFNPVMQRAGNHVQSVVGTGAVLDSARADGFRRINFDLGFGLAYQHLVGFPATLDVAVDAAPDRIAVSSYA